MLMLEDEPSFVGEYDLYLEARKVLNKRSGDVECFLCGKESENKSLYTIDQTTNEYMYRSLGIFCKDCMLKVFRLKEIDKED